MEAETTDGNAAGAVAPTKESRADLLAIAIEKTMERMRKVAGFTTFAAAFECLYDAENFEQLKELHGKAWAQAEGKIIVDIAQLIDEAKVNDHLNELDKILLEPNKSGKSWRPSGDPNKDMRVRQRIELVTYHEKLSDEVAKQEERTKLLFAKVEEERAAVLDLDQQTADCIDAFSNVNIPNINDFALALN